MKNKKNFKERFKFFKNKIEGTPFYYFDIECGEGWSDLLWKLCEGIEEEIKKSNIEDFCVTQIKEKFGGLRFYFVNGNDKIRELINKAEDDSFEVCELCGAEGKLKKINGWFSTLCEKCRRKDD